MTGDASSYRRILWATSVVGGATLASLVIGLARNKAVALIGGPEAIGILGLFTSIVSMGASIATLGLDTGAVRQVSRSVENRRETARTRRAIWTLAWPLALVGAAATWVFREPLAEFSTSNVGYATAVGALGIGVAATVIASSQLAVLQGYGRVGDLARVRLWGSLVATALGVIAIYWYHTWGIVLAVVATPLVTTLWAFWLGRNLAGSEWGRLFKEKLGDQWQALASIGAVVMITNAVVTLSQLSTRAIITQQLGLDSTGLYHASWSITWVNLSLVLNAMAADYFPRISRVAHEPWSVSLTLNQQLHIGLLLAGPALVIVSTAAPVMLTVLYSTAFTDSALLLRLLIVAGVLRLPIWALGYILLARRAGTSYFLGELAAASIIPLTWLLLPVAGLPGAGVAAVLSAVISFSVYLGQVHRSHGVRISAGNAKMLGSLFLLLTTIAVVFELSPTIGMLIGVSGAGALGWHSYRELRSAIRG